MNDFNLRLRRFFSVTLICFITFAISTIYSRSFVKNALKDIYKTPLFLGDLSQIENTDALKDQFKDVLKKYVVNFENSVGMFETDEEEARPYNAAKSVIEPELLNCADIFFKSIDTLNKNKNLGSTKFLNIYYQTYVEMFSAYYKLSHDLNSKFKSKMNQLKQEAEEEKKRKAAKGQTFIEEMRDPDKLFFTIFFGLEFLLLSPIMIPGSIAMVLGLFTFYGGGKLILLIDRSTYEYKIWKLFNDLLEKTYKDFAKYKPNYNSQEIKGFLNASSLDLFFNKSIKFDQLPESINLKLALNKLEEDKKSLNLEENQLPLLNNSQIKKLTEDFNNIKDNLNKLSSVDIKKYQNLVRYINRWYFSLIQLFEFLNKSGSKDLPKFYGDIVAWNNYLLNKLIVDLNSKDNQKFNQSIIKLTSDLQLLQNKIDKVWVFRTGPKEAKDLLQYVVGKPNKEDGILPKILKQLKYDLKLT